MAEWYDNRNMGSAFPLMDYGSNQLAEYANNALPNTQNNPGLSWWMNSDRGRYASPMMPDNLTQDLGAANYRAPFPGSAYSPQRGFEEMQFDETVQAPDEKTGFSFPLSSLFSPFNKGIGRAVAGAQWIGEKFKRPEAKQRFYDEVMQGRSLEPYQTGMYKGNEYGLYNSPSGLKVGSDIIGWGEGYEKNLDSMFGSQSIEEMEEKKLDWAQKRYEKLGRRGLGTRIYNALIKNRPQVLGDATTTRAPITKTTTTAPGTGTTTGGGGRNDYTRDRGGGYTLGGGFADQRSGPRGSTTSRGDVRGHHSRADGGRIGYRDAGSVEEQEDLNVFEFMKDQGIPSGEMASYGFDDAMGETYQMFLDGKKNGTVPIDMEFDEYLELLPDQSGIMNEEGIASIV